MNGCHRGRRLPRQPCGPVHRSSPPTRLSVSTNTPLARTSAPRKGGAALRRATLCACYSVFRCPRGRSTAAAKPPTRLQCSRAAPHEPRQRRQRHPSSHTAAATTPRRPNSQVAPVPMERTLGPCGGERCIRGLPSSRACAIPLPRYARPRLVLPLRPLFVFCSRRANSPDGCR